MDTVYILSMTDHHIHFFAEAVHKSQKLSIVEAEIKKIHISKGPWSNPPIELDSVHEFHKEYIFSSKKDLFEHVFYSNF